jgi:hypothetical protein
MAPSTWRTLPQFVTDVVTRPRPARAALAALGHGLGWNPHF